MTSRTFAIAALLSAACSPGEASTAAPVAAASGAESNSQAAGAAGAAGGNGTTAGAGAVATPTDAVVTPTPSSAGAGATSPGGPAQTTGTASAGATDPADTSTPQGTAATDVDPNLSGAAETEGTATTAGGAAQPGTPGAAGPGVADPNVADPSATDPNVADPSAADPNVPDPNVAGDAASEVVPSGPTGSCAMPEVRITEIAIDSPVIGNGGEGDTERLPMAIAARASGGSMLAWLGEDSAVHVVQLDANDEIVGSSFSLPAVDLQDIAAEDDGGVVMLTRDAQGGGTLNCGTPANLCDGGPSPDVPCYDMYLVRFDGGSETWAAKLTNSSAELPPYSTGPDGPTVNMIWWYQNHGRIATDGSNYAGYFCNAISVSEGGCINIHEGDRMQVVDPTGKLVDHEDAFGLGCSHSWNTRIVWDESTGHFVMVCATDNNNRIARPDPYRTISSTPDIGTASVGDLIVSSAGGYWVSVSHAGSLRLLHFDDVEPDQEIDVGSADFSHLVAYGPDNMLVTWEQGAGMLAEVRSNADGALVSAQFSIDVTDHRYQAFKSFPDGSVAYPAQGADNRTIRIARVMPCE